MEKRKTNKSSDGATSKPIWKKWWFWAIVVIALISGTNTISYNKNQQTQENIVGTETQTTEETKLIEETKAAEEAPLQTEKQEKTELEKETIEMVEESTAEKEKHIYDNAIVKPIINGSRTEKIGEYSIIETDSSLVTEENLTDWYFNYVANSDFNYGIILYTDKNNKEGVYAIEGFVEKNAVFDKDEFGDYYLRDSSQSIIFAPTDEGTLKEIK